MNTSAIVGLNVRSKADDLWRVITRKKSILAELSSRCEMLQIELDQIKREYYIRVGSLLDRDNRLDMEIIVQKTVLSFMKSGFTYEEALEKLKGKYFGEGVKRSEKDDRNSIPEKKYENESRRKGGLLKLKQVWKKAVMKFHPDLATDSREKKAREELMRKINKAYAEYDTDTLEDIIQNSYIYSRRDVTIEELKHALVTLENKIIATQKKYKDLKSTEWYRWKAKIRVAKKSGIDIFREMENALLDDIIQKMRILSELKQEINNI